MTPHLLSNHTYDELLPGLSASIERVLEQDDLTRFAALSGDNNPAHLDQTFAANSMFHGVVAHGMWSGMLISRVLGTVLPGPGTVYLSQSLNFHRPARPGQRLRVTVTVLEQLPRQRIRLATTVHDQHGTLLTDGTAEVLAPSEKLRLDVPELAELVIREHAHYHRLMRAAQALPMVRVAVAHPCTPESLGPVLEAVDAGLIEAVLVGPKARLEAAGQSLGRTLDGMQCVDSEHSHHSAALAVELAREKRVAMVMKGSLHTSELLQAILDPTKGVRTQRRLSHCYALAYPGREHPLLVTDAAINIEPGLDDKIDICQNAIDLARVLGIELPKVAILSAVETVKSKLPGTLDAAALCKMAERGQITGGILDGPLSYDLAMDSEAVRIKELVSPVAGQADILLAPNLEAGNLLVKQMTFSSGLDAAGLVLGARVPIVLTSRADSARIRLASIALGKLVAVAKLQQGALPTQTPRGATLSLGTM